MHQPEGKIVRIGHYTELVVTPAMERALRRYRWWLRWQRLRSLPGRLFRCLFRF